MSGLKSKYFLEPVKYIIEGCKILPTAIKRNFFPWVSILLLLCLIALIIFFCLSFVEVEGVLQTLFNTIGYNAYLSLIIISCSPILWVIFCIYCLIVQRIYRVISKDDSMINNAWITAKKPLWLASFVIIMHLLVFFYLWDFIFSHLVAYLNQNFLSTFLYPSGTTYIDMLLRALAWDVVKLIDVLKMVVGILLYSRLYLWLPLIIIEKRGFIDSLVCSFKLTRDNRFSVFGIVFIFSYLPIVLYSYLLHCSSVTIIIAILLYIIPLTLDTIMKILLLYTFRK